ncbi:hypothetical protein D3C80_1688400 [compost metagenome]
MALILHLFKHALRDVVVAAPVRCPFGIGKLVKIMPTGFCGEFLCHGIHIACVFNKMTTPAKPLDSLDFLRACRTRHDRDEGQIQQIGEIGFRYGC